MNNIRKIIEERLENAKLDYQRYFENIVIDDIPFHEDKELKGQIEAYQDCLNLIPEDLGELSDGYHTFNSLYEQRCILFATIVNQNKDKAWKSYKHEDGQLCFGGGWFIVGIDTPEGSYTYHYENKYWNLFKCQELECGKKWDGHTDKDVSRLLRITPAPRTEQEILKDFEALGYEVVCNSDRELILEQELKSNYTIINRIHIDKQLQSYSKTQFAYRVGSSPLWVFIPEHKLLNELFICWGWI